MQTQNVNDGKYREALDIVGLKKEHLIYPIMVQGLEKEVQQINTMPGMAKIPLKKLVQYIQMVVDAGISSIILFGIPERRKERGHSAAHKYGIVQQALKNIKKNFGDTINIITDVCVCQYNLSGHCGLVVKNKVDNDATLHILSEIALSHAEAGADIVAPSSMMDGEVYSIRKSLNEYGFQKIKILPYSAKHFSSLYIPFRAAAFSTTSDHKIDKSSYQIAYTNPKQTLREIEADINEGADMVMVKPGLIYLDLICMIKEKFGFPTVVQNVSGEYSMIKAAAAHRWIEEEEWKIISLASIKRSGADRIISYFSMDIARYLDH